MRGQYNLTQSELTYWSLTIDNALKELACEPNAAYDLSTSNIGPCQVDDVLEVLGWERKDMDTNGWEQDTWYSYQKEDKYLTMFYCGWTGAIELYWTFRDD